MIYFYYAVNAVLSIYGIYHMHNNPLRVSHGHC